MTGCLTDGARRLRIARRSAISSSRPRLPGGFVRLSRWRRASGSPSRAGGALIHAAQEVAKPQTHRGLRMDARADLIRNQGEAGAAADQPREPVRLLEDRVVAVAAEQEVRDPQGEAVDDDSVARPLETLELRDEIEGLLDRRPAGRALGAMAGDPFDHVLVARLGGGDDDDARLGGEPLDREAALAAAGPAQDQERWSHLPGSSREDR